MKFAVITHVLHHYSKNKIIGYTPYIREMNLWFQYADEVCVVAPLQRELSLSKLEIPYNHNKLSVKKVPAFSLISIKAIFFTVFKLPLLLFQIWNAMKWADHIHLRCPGNMGLLGCFLQIFFPSTPKTVKYAGNWDPNSKQPWSYKLQKWIISNTFLSRNIKVLVYGEWPNQTKNILPFFTASFPENEIESIEKDFSNNLDFLFVGSLVEGKNPLFAIRLVEQLRKSGREVKLKIFGEGPLKIDLEDYIQINDLSCFIKVFGGISLNELKNEYKKSHFSILPSKSEGWPKAVAEAMFFGCVPISTRISCVPWMLDEGRRGILLTGELKTDLQNLIEKLRNRKNLSVLSNNAMQWSQNYTLEYFESEIKMLL